MDDQPLWDEIDCIARREKLNIHNLGYMSRSDIMQTYSHSRALIYPSFSESLGLPLIEAHRCNVPIIAPELDFVRDVCSPAETFDPHSPTSIARAVQRFLGNVCLLYTSPSPRDATLSRMPSSA